MKKRMRAWALISALCLGLFAGCGSNGEEQASSQSGNASTAGGEEGSKVIAFVPKTLNNPFFVAIKDNIEAACAENGWTVKVNAADAETEVDKQISICLLYTSRCV